MALRGILYAPTMQPTLDPSPCLNLRGAYGKKYPDYRSRALIPVYTYFDARHRPQLTGQAVSVMMDKWPDVLWVLSNARVMLDETAYNEINSGRIAEGKAILLQAVALFSGDAYAYSTLGVLAEKQNDLFSAERYNQLAITADSSYADAYYNAGHYQDASEQYRALARQSNLDKATRNSFTVAAAACDLKLKRLTVAQAKALPDTNDESGARRLYLLMELARSRNDLEEQKRILS